jgi:hypothetical protein
MMNWKDLEEEMLAFSCRDPIKTLVRIGNVPAEIPAHQPPIRAAILL